MKEQFPVPVCNQSVFVVLMAYNTMNRPGDKSNIARKFCPCSSPPPPPPADNTLVIALGVSGIIVLLVLVGVGVWCCQSKKKKRNSTKVVNGTPEHEAYHLGTNQNVYSPEPKAKSEDDAKYEEISPTSKSTRLQHKDKALPPLPQEAETPAREDYQLNNTAFIHIAVSREPEAKSEDYTKYEEIDQTSEQAKPKFSGRPLPPIPQGDDKNYNESKPQLTKEIEIPPLPPRLPSSSSPFSRAVPPTPPPHSSSQNSEQGITPKNNQRIQRGLKMPPPLPKLQESDIYSHPKPQPLTPSSSFQAVHPTASPRTPPAALPSGQNMAPPTAHLMAPTAPFPSANQVAQPTRSPSIRRPAPLAPPVRSESVRQVTTSSAHQVAPPKRSPSVCKPAPPVRSPSVRKPATSTTSPDPPVIPLPDY